MLEQLDFLIRRYDIDLRLDQGHLKSDSCLSQFNGFVVLSVRRGLEGAALAEAIAVQIGRLVLGHEGRRWRWLDERQDRREWAQALRWAAKTLITDELMAKAERQEWELWQLAEEAGVTERLAGTRMDGWLVNHLGGEESSRLDRQSENQDGASPFFIGKSAGSWATEWALLGR